MEVSVSRGGKMESSLRWSIGLVAAIVCQVGCCSVQMNCGTPGCRVTPCAATQPSVCEGECGMVGMEPLFHGHGHLKQKIHSWAASTRCTSGCGEVYWGEHISEPPTCDPCGMAGDYTGGCGSCRPWYSRLRDLWGYRYEPSGCSQGGCTSCGCSGGGVVSAGHFGGGHGTGSCASCSQGMVSEGEVIHEGEATHSAVQHATPTPAKPKAQVAPTPVPDANASHQRRSGTNGNHATTTTERVVRTSPTRIGSGVVQAGSADPRVQLEATKRVQMQNVSAKERLATKHR